MRVKIEDDDLMLLIWYARRYCDDKQSSEPSEFNKVYDSINLENPMFYKLDRKDVKLFNRGSNWPYARDRMKLRENRENII